MTGWILLMGLMGLVAGSLMNVVVYRLPLMVTHDATIEGRRFNLWLPASHCPHCQHTLRWFDNLPLLSWCLLRGRCRDCKGHILWLYPVIELATCLCFITIAVLLPAGERALGMAILLWFSLALSIIDFKTFLLPDALTQPLLWLGLIYHSFTGQIPIQDALYGAVAGYVFLWLVYWAFYLVTGKEGLGYGDFKLLAACGAWSGWQSLPYLVLIAAVLGIIFVLLNRSSRDSEKGHIPFGPALATAGYIMFCWVTIACRH